LGYTDTSILSSSSSLANNNVINILNTPSYPPGIWLFTYQASIYFATAPTISNYISYISGPTITPITQLAKITSGTEVLIGSNQVATHSGSVCVTLTAFTSIALYVLINATTAAQAGGANTTNVQATYITATRIG
jgi:hypothetical protein